jgi:hypothetical protein
MKRRLEAADMNGEAGFVGVNGTKSIATDTRPVLIAWSNVRFGPAVEIADGLQCWQSLGASRCGDFGVSAV